MSLPVIVLGAGGHAKVLIDILRLRGIKILCLIDPKLATFSNTLNGIRLIDNEDEVLRYQPDEVRLVNGLGSVSDTTKRTHLFQKLKNLGYSFASLIHPSAIIASDVKLAEGVQIMAGAIIQAGSNVGQNAIINTKASIDHDCVIGNHVHIAPGVTLSGGVTVGDRAHIGTGATIIQNVRIGQSSIVGAGALVLKDVPEGAKVLGVAAKVVTTNDKELG
ncbi:acetyltransferase [Zhaonella formicivorans]|uniref:acetyltransferase n=1 Tax=Zhaonella formicivorans TaxID=2528593 RepID=UPI0010E7A2EC|nr:acetyltransferase [Zhaonella formicivorans]